MAGRSGARGTRVRTSASLTLFSSPFHTLSLLYSLSLFLSFLSLLAFLFSMLHNLNVLSRAVGPSGGGVWGCAGGSEAEGRGWACLFLLPEQCQPLNHHTPDHHHINTPTAATHRHFHIHTHTHTQTHIHTPLHTSTPHYTTSTHHYTTSKIGRASCRERV